ncbi:translocation/assembly module TamB domain-containing protein [Hydrogenimonas sp.]
MRKLYSRLALGMQGAVMATGLFFYVTLHPETTEYIARKALAENGIGYSRIEGTLYTGFDLYDVRFKKAFAAKHIALHYSIFRLFSPVPTLDEIVVENCRLHPDQFEMEKPRTNGSVDILLPPIVVRKIRVETCDVYTPEPVGIDLIAKNLRWFGTDVSIPSFRTSLRTSYAHGSFEGTFHDERLEANGHLSLAEKYRKMAIGYLRSVPKRVPVELEADRHGLRASTRISSPIVLKEANLSIDRFALDFDYLVEGNYFTAKAKYHLKTPAAEADLNHSLLFTPSLAYATKIEGEILRTTYPLPARRFEADAAGDREIVTAKIHMGPFWIDLYSTDYERYAIRAKARPHTLAYLEHLPDLFSRQTVSMEANATATISPDPALKGIVHLDGNYSRSRSFIEIRPGSLLINASLTPKNTESGTWELLPPTFRSRINTYIYYSDNNKLFNISMPKAYLTLFERDRKVKGWADIGSLTLDVSGKIEPDDTVDLHFHTHLDSLYALMEELKIESDLVVDAEVESRFDVRIADRLYLRYETRIPWYLVQPDSQTVHYGLDSLLTGDIRGEEISIDRYDIGFKDRHFRQNRPSYFHFDEKRLLHIERFAILDTGILRGTFDPVGMEGKFRFDAENMHYRGPEGNVTANATIDAEIAHDRVDIEGEVELTEANVTFIPKKEYTVTDEDIVVIQDLKEPSHTKKSLNIHIYSNRPLDYEIPMVHLRFLPDMTIWKEPFKPTVLLGIVRVPEGSIDVEEKHFDIEPSEIYFAGAWPVNPWLDLRIRYEIDFNRFTIYVSHTLADPVFLFSSDPPMNQNDIMSYILFGTPADESFQGSRNASTSVATMLLGFGLKNAIGSVTGLKFDTFNILNTEEGGFGIEIGKRIGKRFRIVYRNDTLSSFILQYRLSRNVRIDVDVKETGQGVNVLYIKDFRGPEAFDAPIGSTPQKTE